jgi:hypothetical protein
MKKHILGGLLTAAILLCGSLLYAEDFVFNVPVELYKIPADIKAVGVAIEVYDKELTGWDLPAGSTRIGYGSSGGSIVNGEYVGNVTVKFNAQPGKKPEKAIGYRGWLLLYGPGAYQGGCLSAMGLDGPYPYDPQKPMVCAIYGKLSSSTMKQIPTRPLPGMQKQMK